MSHPLSCYEMIGVGDAEVGEIESSKQFCQSQSKMRPLATAGQFLWAPIASRMRHGADENYFGETLL